MFLPDDKPSVERFLWRQPGEGDLVVVDLGDGQVAGRVRVDGGERDVGLAQQAVAQRVQLKHDGSLKLGVENEHFTSDEIGNKGYL
jgi:hypothetical protein